MKFYRVADYPTLAEFKALDIPVMHNVPPKYNVHVVRTGEFREPKRGEWYLSGAIPAGYRATNDLSTKYHIVRLVKTQTQTVIVPV